MKTKSLFCFILLHSSFILSARAQGTAFTYQGRLNDGANPATGIYDLRFAIYDSTNLPGTVVAGPLTNSPTAVSNGLFTVTLDFGAGVFDGSARWLQISVRTNGSGAFTTLTARQPLTATPYAITAGNVNGLRIQTNATSPNFIGGYSGNNASAGVVGAVVVGGGDSGNVNHVTDSYGFVGGGRNNQAGHANGNQFATVGGGLNNSAYGADASIGGGYANENTGNFSTIAGGSQNRAAGVNGAVGGGQQNSAGGLSSVVAGGQGNTASGTFSSVGGGNNNFATGFGTTVPGGQANLASGQYSFAAGQHAGAVTDGTFVWADSTTADFSSISNNQFLVLASGGVGIGTNNPQSALHVNGTVTANNFSGSGAGLSNVSAASLTGTLPPAQLPSGVLTNNASGVNLNGTFSGNGAGVTNLNLALNSFGAISYPGNFIITSSLDVGGGSYSVTVADVNGDGKMDLISTTGNNFLTVSINNGSGRFVNQSYLDVGSTPWSVTSADVNGDGKVDLITANSGDNTLTVLTNNGSGGFVIGSSPVVGSQPWSVKAADVNGDGIVDLISANYGANTLTVLTNNGSGGFTISSSPGVDSNPRSVTVADVNGDGKVDLISANYGANTLTVLTNNGSGGFALASAPGVGINPWSVTAADVNGDGKVDLISANPNGSLTLLTNNGSSGFSFASSPPVAGGHPYWVVAMDVNGDGRPDLISGEGEVLFNTLTFAGSGAGLTGVNASLLGGLPRNAYASASALYALNAGNISSGTLDDTRLSSNVALRSGGNSFTGNQTVTGGSMGIGTGSPATALHVMSSSSDAEISVQSGDASSHRWTMQGSSHGNSGQLADSFQIIDRNVPAARLLIDTSGNVGIGTAIPNALLTVNGTASKPGGGSWSTFSDGRLKDIGADFTHGLEALNKIQPVHYHYKSDNSLNLPSQPEYVGVVAQQVQQAVPEAVQRNKDGYLVVNNDPIIWTMVNAIKELKAENDALKQRLVRLESGKVVSDLADKH